MAKALFWLWLIISLILNTISLGLENSRTLSTRLVANRELFRMDYLLHLISFLAFAWIFILGQVRNRPVFHSHALIKFMVLVLSTAVVFEVIQLILPYRKFNPIDMRFNLAGALLGIVLVGISRRATLSKEQQADIADKPD